MNRQRWKQIEREMALALGGQRVPVSGRSRGDQPDIRHSRWSCEVKAGAILSTRLLDGYEQAKAAAKEGQIPIVCIANRSKGNKNTSGKYVLIGLDDFVGLVKE